MLLNAAFWGITLFSSQAAAYLTSYNLHRNAPSLPLGLWRSLKARESSELIDAARWDIEALRPRHDSTVLREVLQRIVDRKVSVSYAPSASRPL